MTYWLFQVFPNDSCMLRYAFRILSRWLVLQIEAPMLSPLSDSEVCMYVCALASCPTTALWLRGLDSLTSLVIPLYQISSFLQLCNSPALDNLSPICPDGVGCTYVGIQCKRNSNLLLSWRSKEHSLWRGGQWLLDAVPTFWFGFSDFNHSIAKGSFLCWRKGAGHLHRPTVTVVLYNWIKLDQTGSNWIKLDQTGSYLCTSIHPSMLYFEKTAASA